MILHNTYLFQMPLYPSISIRGPLFMLLLPLLVYLNVALRPVFAPPRARQSSKAIALIYTLAAHPQELDDKESDI